SVSRVVIVDRDYIERVKRQSRGSDKPDSPWVRWEEAMILKTVVHRLEPWVPTSVDDLRAAHVAPDAPAVSTPHHPRPLPVEQPRSEEHTSELQSRENLVCRLLLEKKKASGPDDHTGHGH